VIRSAIDAWVRCSTPPSSNAEFRGSFAETTTRKDFPQPYGVCVRVSDAVRSLSHQSRKLSTGATCLLCEHSGDGIRRLFECHGRRIRHHVVLPRGPLVCHRHHGARQVLHVARGQRVAPIRPQRQRALRLPRHLHEERWVTLRASWVTLRARWVTLRARWVTLRASWVTLRARWVTLRAHWVTLRARWVTLRASWVTLRAHWVTLRAHWVTLRARWVS
jgi:hypothetical protein